MLIPQENVKDLEEIPDNVKKALEIVPVEHVDQVLSHALVRMPEPIKDWVEVEEASIAAKGEEDGDEVRKH